jgi:ubiquinone/menaquinone biosynthesis C-methylase UbiE
MYRAKTRYQAENVAEEYETQRFRSLRGRLVNWLEKTAAIQMLEGLPKASLILDAPVGTGRISAALEQAGWRVIGADISAPMLQQAQQRHVAHLGLVQADIERLPFMDNAVDAVVSYRLMAHLPGPVRQTVLGEMARVTQGPLIINYHLSGTSALWAVNSVMRRSALAAYPITPRDVQAEAKACGLYIVRVRALLLGVLDSYLCWLARFI